MATGRVIRRALENQVQRARLLAGRGALAVPHDLGPGSRRGADLRSRDDDAHIPARELSRPLRRRGPAAPHRDRPGSRGAACASSAWPQSPEPTGVGHRRVRPSGRDRRPPDRLAGFGGQGVLLLGEFLAEAGLSAGYHVSWLPSYGPQMRSGTSNCHVRISAAPIDSPLVSRPTVLNRVSTSHPCASSCHRWSRAGSSSTTPTACRRTARRTASGSPRSPAPSWPIDWGR